MIAKYQIVVSGVTVGCDTPEEAIALCATIEARASVDSAIDGSSASPKASASCHAHLSSCLQAVLDDVDRRYPKWGKSESEREFIAMLRHELALLREGATRVASDATSSEHDSARRDEGNSPGCASWLQDVLDDVDRRSAERPAWAKGEYAREEIARLRAISSRAAPEASPSEASPSDASPSDAQASDARSILEEPSS